MNLSIVGTGKEVKESIGFPRSNTLIDSKPVLKPSTRKLFEKPRSLTKPSETLRPSIILTQPNPHLQKPDKTPDASFHSHNPYISFQSPKPQKFLKIESKLDTLHKNFAKIHLSEIRIKNLSVSNFYLERISEWSKEKASRQEELVRRLEWLKKSENYSPGQRQFYDGDDEDISYSFMSKVGSTRRTKQRILDVAARPSYLAPEGYISMQPYVVYNSPKVRGRISGFEEMEEAFRVKKALAAREVCCRIDMINGTGVENYSKELPKGGEMLFRC